VTASDNPESDRVVEFPGSEEKARRLRVEVERLARLPTVEWMFYAANESHAAKYGVDCSTLKRMVEVIVKETEKKQREEQAERRRDADRDAKKARQDMAKKKEDRADK
jgi:hypothetical protein